MQWLQAAAATLYCDLFDLPMEIAFGAPQMETAAWLSLLGVLVIAFGMRIALSSMRRGRIVARAMEADVNRWQFERVVILWLGSWMIGVLASAIGWRYPSVHQFFVPLTQVKWIFFYIMSYTALRSGRNLFALALIVMVEFFGGFLGWFSSYKEVLLMVIIAAITTQLKLRPLQIIVIGIVGSVLLATSIFWASIKNDYRYFVSGGREGAHGLVVVSVSDQFHFLHERLIRMDADRIEDGVKRLISRVSYTQLFGNTLEYTPRFEPHSKGELWLGAMKHVLMPRIIFRNKVRTDDSERARRFTGMRVAGTEGGTSIGIGYFAESYADFGKAGMFVPLFLIGVLMGLIYDRSLLNRQSCLLGSAIGTTIIFSMLQVFAMSNMKIIGGLILLCLGFWALNGVLGAGIIRWVRR